jgi:WD40 repeat protein
MSHIFISYARKDIDFAQKIVTALAESKLDTWIDRKSIPKGEDWEQEIYRGIEEADAFLFLISPDSVASNMCNKEIAHAVKNGKRILPIVLRDTDSKNTPPEVSKRNWIFCHDEQDDFNKAIDEIRKTIHTDYEWLKSHTDLQVKALKWERRKDNSRLLRGKELQEAEKQLTGVGSKDPQPTDLQRYYLLNSQRYEERLRRQTIVGLSLGLIVVAMLAIFAWVQRNNALDSEAKAERQAQIALARQIAVQAELLRNEQPNPLEQSALLAAEALGRFQDLGEVSQAAYQTLRQDLAVLPKHIVDLKHSENISSVRYSPDGKWIATSMVDPTQAGYPVIVWRASDGVETYKLETRARVTALEFSPDSQYLATGSSNGLVQMWDISTGREKFSLTHDPYINDLAFGRDGNILVSAGQDGTARIWNLKNMRQRPLIIVHGAEILALAISQDGKYLATAGDDEAIRVWDLRDSNEIGRLDFSTGSQAFKHLFSSNPSSRMAFSSDSLFLAVGDAEGLVQVWDVTDRQVRWASIHENAVTAVVFSPDRNYVASASTDGTVRVWQLDNGQEYLRIPHGGVVNNVVYSSSGTYLVSASADGTARAWETRQGTEIARMTHSTEVEWVTLSPDGIHATTIGGKTATIWEVSNHREYAKFFNLAAFALNPDNRHFVGTPGRGIATVFDIASGSEGRSVIHSAEVGEIEFTRDGAWVATSDGVIVKVWKVIGDSNVFELHHSSIDTVRKMSFSPDGKLLATVSYSGQVRIWDWMNTDEVTRFQVPGERSSLVFSEDGDHLAAIRGGTAWLFSIANGQKIGQVAWSNEANTLLYTTGAEIKALKATPIPFPETPGEVIVAYFPNPTISPDGRYQLSITSDTLIVDDMVTGKEFFRLKHEPELVEAVFSPDGRFLVTNSWSFYISDNRYVRFWLWQPNDLIKETCSRLLRNLDHAEWNQYVGEDIPYHATCTNLPLPTD